MLLIKVTAITHPQRRPQMRQACQRYSRWTRPQVEGEGEARFVNVLFHTTCLLMDSDALALGSVRRPQYRRGAMSPLNQGDNDGIGNSDDGPSGAFDGNELDDLLTHVQGSKSSVPATNRTSGILPNPQAHVGLERGATPVARSTEQVGRLSSFCMTTDSTAMMLDGNQAPASTSETQRLD